MQPCEGTRHEPLRRKPDDAVHDTYLLLLQRLGLPLQFALLLLPQRRPERRCCS